jgi:hypothetical protein
LKILFDNGLAAPGNLRECALADGVQVYRDVGDVCGEKCVFVL